MTDLYVPARKAHKVSQMLANPLIDGIIVDLEESLPSSHIPDEVRVDLVELADKSRTWVRPRLREAFADPVDDSQLHMLFSWGFSRFVLPKLVNGEEADSILRQAPDGEYMLLVEHPNMLGDLRATLKSIPRISTVALGSHDFFSVVGGQPTRESLNALRRDVAWAAKSFGRNAIDTTCMALEDPDLLALDAFDALQAGMDRKPYIHPVQLELLRKGMQAGGGPAHSQRAWAEQVVQVMDSHDGAGTFTPRRLQGQVVERPHLEWARKVLGWIEKWETDA